MNKSTMIFLARDDIRCCTVAYDIQGHDHKGKPIPKDIKSFKTGDSSVAKDDLVIIPTDNRWGFTVGKVVDVDLHVDYDSNEQMRWIVARVDVATFEAMKKAEDEITNVVAEGDREHRKMELKNQLFAHVDASKLAAIGIVQQAGSALPSPEAPPRSGHEPEQRGGSQSYAAPVPGYPDDDIPF